MIMYLMSIDSQENKSKFEFIYDQYKYLMIRVARDILKNDDEAEDAVHDAFMKIANNMEKIGEVDSIKTKNFVILTTKHTAIDIYRKKLLIHNNEMSVDGLENPDILVSEDVVHMNEENRTIYIINQMPDIYKEIFILKYVNEYTNLEIAEILNISETTIRKRISRGKDIIAKTLNEMEVQ